ncbi:MAG: hypothetical protein ABJN69_07765 [Hellea sp.]
MLNIAQYISYGLGGYVLIGLVFALYFVTRGVRNEAIAGKSLILRILLLPGAVLLWPVLLKARS